VTTFSTSLTRQTSSSSGPKRLSRADFLADETLQRAFVQSLEIIGEATKKISREFREIHPEIEWRAMAGMRDHLVHGYVSVDYELVWDVVANKIPVVRDQVRALGGGDA